MKYARNSRFKRLRFVFDRELRMSNVTDRCAAAYGDTVAFTTDHSLRYLGLAGNTLTFRQVHEVVGRLATLLYRSGLTRFSRAAIYKRNHIDYFLMMLAVMRAGGIAVPVHGGLTPESFAKYAAYTGCEFVYTDAEHLRELPLNECGQVKVWILPGATGAPALLNSAILARDLAPDLPIAAPAPMNRLDDALIVHTSGTTGFPKGVLHHSYSLIRAVRTQLLLNPVPMRERVLAAAHQNHHISFTAMLLSLMGGAWSYVATDFTPERILSTLEREKINMFFAFPDVYLQMYRAGMERYDLSEMRMWFTGGDAMHEVHIRACVAQGRNTRVLGLPIKGSLFVELLGTSEVGAAALIKISTQRTTRYARCVGKPIVIGPKVKVADEHGRPVPKGTAGRLMVHGPTVFKGYWNAHDRLHGVTADNWWWTGDIARMDRDGYFYQLDREADMVITKNGPVYGLPIEEELLKHADVGEAAVIAVSHPTDGTVPVAVAHSRSGRPLDAAAVLAEVNKVLPADQRLRAIIDIGSPADLPRGLTGKVLKRQLRERYANYFARRSFVQYTPPAQITVS